MNPTHILDQIHALPTTTTQHHLALDPHHHFLPPHRLSHHYAAASPSPSPSPSSPYFPLNFKLGLNEICSRNQFKNGGPPDSLLRGSEQYQLPESRHSSLGMLHPPFWEPLPAEVSNENSEIVERHELKQRETLTNCLDAKSRVHFSELDAIYKRLGNADTTQTPPTIQTLPVTAHLPAVGTFDPSGSLNPAKKNKSSSTRKKKKAATATATAGGDPMAEFFEDLVKQVMDHQESLQKKFTEVMDRLNEERREREEAWRNEELAHFEREAAARAHEKAMAKSREAMIVSYLEKITGQRINLPPLATSEITATNTSDDSNC